ncbi:MAG: DUF2029 domain-containing protein [Bdellovibrionales bacterium]|nr:DUF2029 domain-containing protein [Bdellovibrionales bacterium]
MELESMKTFGQHLPSIKSGSWPQTGAYVLTLLVLVTLIRTSVLSESSDFEIFWKTGKRILEFQPIYVPSIDGGRCFKYPPWIAPFFSPFGMLQENAAGILWRLLLTGSLSWVTLMLLSERKPHERVAVLLTFVSMIGVWNHNVMAGQMTPLLIALALLPFFSKSSFSDWRVSSMIVGLSSKAFPMITVLALGHTLFRPSLWVKITVSIVLLTLPALLATPGHSLTQLFRDFFSSSASSGDILGGSFNGLTAVISTVFHFSRDEMSIQIPLAIATTAIVILGWAAFQKRLSSPLERASLALALSISATPLAFTYGLGLAYPWFALRFAQASRQSFRNPRDWVAVAGFAWMILPLPFRAVAPLLTLASISDYKERR